jgi:YidC/Oxa1 family membrane protein insertase
MIEFIKVLLYYPFLNLLTFFVWLVPGHHVAWGIILLTLTVRFALYLPTKKQAESQRKTMELAPLLQELKEEYGTDRQGLAIAQMELYKKNGINPFSSCLTALVQIPILFILYYAILHGIDGNSPHLYSWLPRPESVQTVLFGIDLLKPDKAYILPAIAAILQFWQMRLTLAKVKPSKSGEIDPMIASQRTMVYIFPLLTLFIAGSFPAGVALYWIVSTAFSVVQQLLVNRQDLTLTGLKEVVAEADKKHPEFKHSNKTEKLLLEEKKAKGGVTVKVRKKS